MSLFGIEATILVAIAVGGVGRMAWWAARSRQRAVWMSVVVVVYAAILVARIVSVH